MTSYRGEAAFRHDEQAAIGILLSNLGTPQAPTARALRPYLRQFLSDPRVIELPKLQWSLILNLFVLPTRPAQSAKLYEQVWTPEGSPLLLITRRQAAALEQRLRAALETPIHVAVGMRYGEPSLARALEELADRGCRRVLVLAMYPQYAAATTASTFDEVTRVLTGWRWVPELRTIHGYHDDPGYVAALAASIRELWDREGEPDRLQFSFHGMPVRYFRNGDPYFCFCQKTARLTAEALGIGGDRYGVSFQSRFGREEWLKPYTDETLAALPGQGIKRLDVLCPGFAADCLETIEEIDGLNRKVFLDAGGERYRYVPCLNDRADHLAALAALVRRHLGGWIESPPAGAAERNATLQRARAMGAPPEGGGGDQSARAPQHHVSNTVG